MSQRIPFGDIDPWGSASKYHLNKPGGEGFAECDSVALVEELTSL